MSSSTRRRRFGRWALIAVLVAAGIGLFAVSSSLRTEPAVPYQTEMARQGALTVTITATGELQSLTQVNIGTEISGVVESVSVDFNSAVRVGQILAQVNVDKLQAQAGQGRAGLDAARAKRLQSQATLAEAEAQLARLQNVRELSGGKVPSKLEIDSQEAAVKRAQADDVSSQAQVTQAEASLAAIETDIRKAAIRSPINGIVLDRQVDPGQTVAASFQTPVLFTLAEDLTKMKLVVDVDEADIGMVRLQQTAQFRVDAYPGRSFPSRVVEIRSTPKTSNGVVTYETILTVDNSERLLQPGMTATATITVTEIADTLLVPNAALRFTPPAASAPQGQGFRLLPAPPGATRRTVQDSSKPRVWTLRGTEAVPIDISTGASDGQWTAVSAGDLTPGMALITDIATTEPE